MLLSPLKVVINPSLDGPQHILAVQIQDVAGEEVVETVQVQIENSSIEHDPLEVNRQVEQKGDLTAVDSLVRSQAEVLKSGL